MRFGALEFRGGLELTSKDKRFGGISALHMDADGSRFLALTDRGAWLKGRIVYRDGRPAGLADVEMAPILAWDGKPLAKHGWYDTESLAEDGAGHAYVGIERVEKIVRFDLKKGLLARGQPIPVPPDFKTFVNNKSLECLAIPPKGSPLAGQLIAVTERSLDAAGNHRAFLLHGKQFGRFSVKRSDDFDVSDCAILPPNDLLLLERSYSPLSGVAMRIRRIRARRHQAGRAGRRHAVDRRRPRLSDRQHGRHRRLARRARRHYPDAGVGRQFLRPPAHAAAAVQAGGGVMLVLSRAGTAIAYRLRKRSDPVPLSDAPKRMAGIKPGHESLRFESFSSPRRPASSPARA